jgi:hypothetical protein
MLSVVLQLSTTRIVKVSMSNIVFHQIIYLCFTVQRIAEKVCCKCNTVSLLEKHCIFFV